MTEPSPAPSSPVPVLFLVADTGGGHRAAAQAVAGRLRHAWPGRFEPVLLDPLAGPGSAWLLRRVARLYGPAIRHVPWLWGAAYRVTNSRPAMTMLERTLLRLADRPVARAVAALAPALVVSFHPLVNGAAARAWLAAAAHGGDRSWPGARRLAARPGRLAGGPARRNRAGRR
ncbi:MAG: hypothetical protein J2P35_18055, partial [Actinobacteria bacterium]|nr:hypothetical protein [Actinomycetota bacterium]